MYIVIYEMIFSLLYYINIWTSDICDLYILSEAGVVH